MNTAINSCTSCTCGDPTPHIIARRTTADGIGIEIWHDGAITGRMGFKLQGVPVARPRTASAVLLAQATAALFAGDVELYAADELGRLYECARRVAARGGLPGDLRAAFHQDDGPSVRLDWDVYATDRTGTATVRVARLDRIRWPGLVVWHERGRYELLVLRRGFAPGVRSSEALESTGFSFDSQRDLCAHLFTCRADRS